MVKIKLSTKGRYGARLMLELALHYGEGPVLLREVAQRQEISEKYLGHLIPPLKAAGLINSSRGAHGGYILSKYPEDINLAEILRTLEGNLSIVECVSSPDVCSRVDSCVTRNIWNKIDLKIADVLGGISLRDMVNEYREKQKTQVLTYNI